MTDTSLGFGFVGTGMISGVHAQTLKLVPGTRVVAVASRSPERGRTFAETHGIGAVMESVEALAARADVDVVCIGTPSGDHLEPALAAIRAGKHVVIEKPLEITTTRVDEILNAADAAGVVVAPIFQQRFSVGAQTAKAAMDAGRLGRLGLASCYVKWFRQPSYYSTSEWKGTQRYDGGGALMNQGIHGVDLLQWLAGLPVEVSGYTTRRVHTGIEVEDTAVGALRYADGAMGSIEASTACWPGWALRIELCGENGAIRLEDGVITQWQFREEQPGDTEIRAGGDTSMGSGSGSPTGISLEGHRRQLSNLVGALRRGEPLAVPSAQARRAVALITALYESAAAGRPVAVQ